MRPTENFKKPTMSYKQIKPNSKRLETSITLIARWKVAENFFESIRFPCARTQTVMGHKPCVITAALVNFNFSLLWNRLQSRSHRHLYEGVGVLVYTRERERTVYLDGIKLPVFDVREGWIFSQGKYDTCQPRGSFWLCNILRDYSSNLCCGKLAFCWPYSMWSGAELFYSIVDGSFTCLETFLHPRYAFHMISNSMRIRKRRARAAQAQGVVLRSLDSTFWPFFSSSPRQHLVQRLFPIGLRKA